MPEDDFNAARDFIGPILLIVVLLIGNAILLYYINRERSR